MRNNFSEFECSLIKAPSVAKLMIGSETDWKMPLITLALLSIVAATFIKFITLIRARLEKHKIFDKGNIPSIGNKGPFAGNLLTMKMDNNSLRRYHGRMGKSFGFFYGPDPWVVTMDRKVLHELIVLEGNKHVDTPQARAIFVNEFDRSTFQLRGNEWRRVRRILSPPFAHRQMKTDNVFRDIEDVCTKVLTCIRGYPLESDGRIIGVLNVFQKFTLEIIFRVAYGRENAVNMDPDGKDKFIELLHEALRRLMNPARILSIMFDCLRRPYARLVNCTQAGHLFKLIQSTISDCIVDRKRMLTSEGDNKSQPARKMIDTLIELVENNRLDHATLEANMLVVLIAGFDTSANALTSMFWLLAWHPNIQEKLRQAIRNEGEEAIYLDWCIKETLRLFPSVPFTGRIATENITTSQGQTIFKGTTVIANIFSVHHCAEYWGPDVEEFRPERFSEPLQTPTQYFSFGGGPRGCLGKNLAKAEIRALVTRIILNFKVETCDSTPGEIVWSAPNSIHTIIEGPISLRFVELNCL